MLAADLGDEFWCVLVFDSGALLVGDLWERFALLAHEEFEYRAGHCRAVAACWAADWLASLGVGLFLEVNLERAPFAAANLEHVFIDGAGDEVFRGVFEFLRHPGAKAAVFDVLDSALAAAHT
jgi:hypothetical protein